MVHPYHAAVYPYSDIQGGYFLSIASRRAWAENPHRIAVDPDLRLVEARYYGRRVGIPLKRPTGRKSGR